MSSISIRGHCSITRVNESSARSKLSSVHLELPRGSCRCRIVEHTAVLRDGCEIESWRGKTLTSAKYQIHVPKKGGSKIFAAQTSVSALPDVEEQQTMVDEMKVQLATRHPELPLGPYGRDNSSLLLWFLKDRKFKVEDAVEKVAKAIAWREQLQVASLTDSHVAEEAQTGKAYLHTEADQSGRPVVIVTAANHFPQEDNVPTYQLCLYLLEKAISKLPDGHEKILGIFDLRGFTRQNTDWKFVHFFIDVFFNYYPKRLGHVLFVDAPPIFRAGWTVVKPMLKSYSSLVRFCSADEVRKEYFTPETTPPTFRE